MVEAPGLEPSAARITSTLVNPLRAACSRTLAQAFGEGSIATTRPPWPTAARIASVSTPQLAPTSTAFIPGPSVASIAARTSGSYTPQRKREASGGFSSRTSAHPPNAPITCSPERSARLIRCSTTRPGPRTGTRRQRKVSARARDQLAERGAVEVTTSPPPPPAPPRNGQRCPVHSRGRSDPRMSGSALIVPGRIWRRRWAHGDLDGAPLRELVPRPRADLPLATRPGAGTGPSRGASDEASGALGRARDRRVRGARAGAARESARSLPLPLGRVRTRGSRRDRGDARTGDERGGRRRQLRRD